MAGLSLLKFEDHEEAVNESIWIIHQAGGDAEGKVKAIDWHIEFQQRFGVKMHRFDEHDP